MFNDEIECRLCLCAEICLLSMLARHFARVGKCVKMLTKAIFQSRELQHQQDPEAPDSLLSELQGLGASPNVLKLPFLLDEG